MAKTDLMDLERNDLDGALEVATHLMDHGGLRPDAAEMLYMLQDERKDRRRLGRRIARELARRKQPR